MIMLGNEAIARGAYEAGVKVSAAYPGTPSTEISENLVQYKEIYCEWSPNEKVAVEVASGAAIAGVRSMACMKHVGLNVASDPLYTMSYIGVQGGMVIVVADDPGMYSSQNEQDTRRQVIKSIGNDIGPFGKLRGLSPAAAVATAGGKHRSHTGCSQKFCICHSNSPSQSIQFLTKIH